MTTPTTHYSWGKPVNAGDNNAWGTELNAIFDSQDSTVFTISGVASAALPATGGAMTGRLDAVTSTTACVSMNSVTGAQNVDLSLANYFAFGFTGSATLTFTNVPSASAQFTNVIVLVFRLFSAGTITWPSSVKWPGGVQPTWSGLGASKNDMVAMCSDDNGTTWRTIGFALNVS